MDSIIRGTKNAFRNTTRTISLAVILGLSIGLSLAMLIAHQAVGQKINSLQAVVGNTIAVSPAGVRGFEGGGNPLTNDQLAPLNNLAHVVSVSKSLNDRLTTSDTSLQSAIDAGALGRRFAGNNGQSFSLNRGEGKFNNGDNSSVNISFTPPITIVGTTSPLKLNSVQGDGNLSLKSGQVFAGNSTAFVALVGTTLASKNSLQTGSTFSAYGKTIEVAGIFDAGNSFSNNQIIMPLASLQSLSNQDGEVTSATVTVDNVTNVDSTTTAVKNTLGSVADVTNSADVANQTIQPLQNIQTISLYSLVAAVIAGAVIILMTMLMIVRERRREIGVLKAIGASNARIMSQFTTEALTLTLLGSVVGIVIGILAGAPLTQTLVTNSSTAASPIPSAGGFAARFSGGAGFAVRNLRNGLDNIAVHVGWDIVLYGLLVAIIIAVLGSGLASFFIAKVRPAEVMRME